MHFKDDLLERAQTRARQLKDLQEQTARFSADWERAREVVGRACEAVTAVAAEVDILSASHAKENGSNCLTVTTKPPNLQGVASLRFRPDKNAHRIVLEASVGDKKDSEPFDIPTLEKEVEAKIRHWFQEFLDSIALLT